MNERPLEKKKKNDHQSEQDAERTRVFLELLALKKKIAAVEKEIAELRKGPKKKTR